MTLVSFPRRLHHLAAADPDRPAVTCGSESITRAELESAANRLARDLSGRGVATGDFVTVAIPNSIDWFVAYAAIWKLGAVPQPVSAKLPARELAAIVELAQSRVVLGVAAELLDHLPPGPQYLPIGYRADDALDDSPLPDAVSPAWKAPTSGGSTGRPKLIVSGDPALIDDEALPPLLIGRDGCLVMPGPLYHNGPAVWSCQALLAGSHVVLLPRFDAETTLAMIERHRADVVYLVPTMMKRISRLPADVRDRYDLSSLRVVWHLAEPCPVWLKQEWIDWLGPERIFELYAGTEAQAATIITGIEWLEHRGSVGRVSSGEVRICDADGNVLPPGEQGEVWLRSVGRDTPTYHYLGADAKKLDGGWESLGDVGWLDADGYLYLGDRLQDMILTGGANVYPAEVEAALLEHPAVHSCVVIGLPDEDRGNIVHAIVQA
ncbi:MAG TPA: AMP-binding protein, partial [Ilumatobacteraceae bacterium]